MRVVPGLEFRSISGGSNGDAKEEQRKEVWGLLRMAKSHANVERATLHEHYREDGDGLLPDWKLEESCSLKYRWQHRVCHSPLFVTE